MGCENSTFQTLSGVYKVDFVANGGTLVDSIETNRVETEPVSTRDVFTFIHWG